MTNTKLTKNAFFGSALSLLLCVIMLIGSTLAWFTDTATTGVNSIVAGNLDLKLEYSTDMIKWEDAEGAQNVFSESKWEPGYTEVVYFRVTNTGTLAFDYEIGTNVVKNITGKNKDGQEIDLTKHLRLDIVETDAAYATRADARNAVPDEDAKTFSGNIAVEGQLVNKNESDTFAMIVWMPENVGNEANHDGENVPSIQLGVNIVAKQAKIESDSYDTKYDDGASWPTAQKLDEITATPGTVAELKAVLETAFSGGAAEKITIDLEQSFDAEGKWDTIKTLGYNGVNKVVINGNGNYIENLNAPLIGKIFAGSDGSIEINNLTIKNSIIEAAGANDEGVGVFLNTTDATNIVKFTKCSLENVEITNTGAESYLGGFLGYSSSASVTFTDCSVKDCNFNGKKDIGAFIGYTQSKMTVENAVVLDTTIASSNASTYRVGLIAGTVNSNPATITTKDIDGNTVTQTSASTVKQSDYVGRILADVFVDGTNIKQ